MKKGLGRFRRVMPLSFCVALLFAAPRAGGADGERIAVRGTWKDAAGKTGWGGLVKTTDAAGNFEGEFAPGMWVRGRREGDLVHAEILSAGKTVGTFSGVLLADGTVQGEYRVQGGGDAVPGKATFNAGTD